MRSSTTATAHPECRIGEAGLASLRIEWPRASAAVTSHDGPEGFTGRQVAGDRSGYDGRERVQSVPAESLLT